MDAPGPAGLSLALKGHWGVGKTHLWKSVVDGVGAARARSRYAYVSLFGLNSIDEVKSAITAAMLVDWVPSRKSSVGAEPSRFGGAGLIPQASRALTALVQDVPFLGAAASAGSEVAATIAYGLVRDALICLDDLERGLSAREIFGLVSQLRDERSCDVVVIMHEDKAVEQGTSQYTEHAEKAIDLHVAFAPSAGETFEIAFEKKNPYRGPHIALIRECCAKLRISNLRILFRVRRTIESVVPKVSTLPDAMVQGALQASVLLTWARYDAEGHAPSFHRIRQGVSQFAMMFLPEDESAEQRACRELLQEYGYYVNDHLDQHIADFVERGWFSEDSLAETVRRLRDDALSAAARERIQDAWSPFYSGFTNSEDEVVKALHSTYTQDAFHADLEGANAAVKTLRRLNAVAEADEVIDAFTAAHEGTGRLEKWRDGPFSVQDLDPRFKGRLDAVTVIAREHRTLPALLNELAYSDGRSYGGDFEFLGVCPVEEYEAFFGEALRDGGSHLRAVVEVCLRRTGFREPKEHDIEVARRAREAVDRIAASCRINRVRVEVLLGDLLKKYPSPDSAAPLPTPNATKPMK
jgi:hypothetical protein